MEGIMKFAMWSISICLFSIAGCSGAGDRPADLDVREQVADAGGDINGCEASLTGDGCEDQGRHLLGEVFDQDGYFSLSTRAVDGAGKSVTLSLTGDASLQASDGTETYGDADPRFLGMKLRAPAGPAGGEIELLAAEPEEDPAAGGREVTYFRLRYRAAGSLRWVDPCAEGQAVPLAGHFDTGVFGPNGRHLASQRLSFACRHEGVAEKCLSWGYSPGVDPTLPPWKAHQVCTRMARGDYCKDGTTHTLDETYILIRDTYAFGMPDLAQTTFPGLQHWPPPVGVFHFEAAWPEDDDQAALCLSKVRWQGLKIGELDSCSAELPDPRQNINVAFCEDMPVVGEDGQPGLSDASLFNGSLYTDLRLEEWRLGSDRVSTVYGYYAGGSSAPVPVKHPFSADYGSAYTHVRTQGTILRSLPGSILPGEVVDVFDYVNGNDDHVLGRAEDAVGPLAGYSLGPWEGKLFVAPPVSGVPSVIALKLWQDTASGDLMTSSAAPSPGHMELATLGYMTVPVAP
jgi:hypothetical protein